MLEMKIPKIGSLVYVEWNDAHHRSGWSTDVQEAAPMQCKSVGWINSASKSAIVLAANRSDANPQWCGEMVIPTCCIVKIKAVRF